MIDRAPSPAARPADSPIRRKPKDDFRRFRHAGSRFASRCRPSCKFNPLATDARGAISDAEIFANCATRHTLLGPILGYWNNGRAGGGGSVIDMRRDIDSILKRGD